MKLIHPEFHRPDGLPVYRVNPSHFYGDVCPADSIGWAELALIRKGGILNEVFTPCMGGKQLAAGLYVSPIKSSRLFQLTDIEYQFLAIARISILCNQYGVPGLVEYPILANQVFARMKEIAAQSPQ